jgi:hypothetical protein
MRQKDGAMNHNIVNFPDPPPTLEIQHCRAWDAITRRMIMSQSPCLAVEEHVHGDTIWVAVRSRGAEWSWLTPSEAVALGRTLIEKYSPPSLEIERDAA